jgi:hypothetical protein
MRLLCGVQDSPKFARAVIRLPPPASHGAPHPFVMPPHNAAHHAPPRTTHMRGTLKGGRVHALVRPPIDSIIRLTRPQRPRHTPLTYPSCLKRYNAADNAPPRTSLMRATLWVVAFSRLLDRLGATCRNFQRLGISLSVGSNARHHPPAHATLMRGYVMRVGCMPLLDCASVYRLTVFILIAHPFTIFTEPDVMTSGLS